MKQKRNRFTEWWLQKRMWWQIKRTIRHNQRNGIAVSSFYVDGNKVEEVL